MASQKGKLYAAVTIVLAMISIALSIYVLWNCEFYEVRYRSKVRKPGLFVCKYYDGGGNGQQQVFTWPTNGFDMMTTLCGFLAPIIGFIALCLTVNSYWKCICKCEKNAAAPPGLFMLSVLAQGLTALVLVSYTCREENGGECKLLTNGYISMGACVGYFLTSCTARNIAVGYGQLPK